MGITIGGDRTIDTIYLFSDCTATTPGVPDSAKPPFNPLYGEKRWYDPNPKPDEDGLCHYTVLATNPDGGFASDVNGLPYTRTLLIAVERAGSLNLVPNPYTGKLKPATPMPLDLSKKPAGWIFGWSQMLPIVPVLHNTAPPAPSATVSFTQADHEALMAIRAKLEA